MVVKLKVSGGDLHSPSYLYELLRHHVRFAFDGWSVEHRLVCVDVYNVYEAVKTSRVHIRWGEQRNPTPYEALSSDTAKRRPISPAYSEQLHKRLTKWLEKLHHYSFKWSEIQVCLTQASMHVLNKSPTCKLTWDNLMKFDVSNFRSLLIYVHT